MTNPGGIGNCENCENWVAVGYPEDKEGNCHRYPKMETTTANYWCREYYNLNRARQILKEIREGK